MKHINPMQPSPHEVLKVIRQTQAEYTFRIACDDEVKPGQFYQLSIPKIGEAPISVCGQGDGWIEFTIRKVGELTYGVHGLDSGDILFMRGPYGNSYPVEDFEDKHLVVISGGTGLAAVRSLIMRFADDLDKVKSLHLIAGFKDRSQILFEEDLISFQHRFDCVCTLDTGAPEDKEELSLKSGMVTAHISNIPFQDFGDDYNVVIVGPPIMFKFASQECFNNGADEHKLWMSFERKMSCAIGKCGHCKINETYVCLEGPIFRYEDSKSLMD
jgi:anaerobic sulfite reductase subunit B